MDHCFLGTLNDDESAHGNRFLVLYDNETEATFAIAVASKSTKEWILEFVKQVLYKVFCSDLKTRSERATITTSCSRQLENFAYCAHGRAGS